MCRGRVKLANKAWHVVAVSTCSIVFAPSDNHSLTQMARSMLRFCRDQVTQTVVFAWCTLYMVLARLNVYLHCKVMDTDEKSPIA